ncbi:MAG: VOC family protein [Candidatus Latescibacterota bacterium]|jgi:hypothetical protein
MAECNPVNWFEIPATDLDRAKTFYERALGLELSAAEMFGLQMVFFPMQQGGPGAGGALVKSPRHQPAAVGTTVYFSVSDLDAALARVEANGGTVISPKTSIGEHGYIAHFRDTEGNGVALHSMAG